MLALAFALAVTVPAVIPDPRLGASSWVIVDLRGEEKPPAASGYLLPVPPNADQAWLVRLVELASGGTPVVGLGVPSDESVVHHLDGVVVSSAQDAERIRSCCPGTVLVGEAPHPTAALTALSWGVTVFLVPGEARWAEAVAGAFPEGQPARWQGKALPTAASAHDLSVLVGIPQGFAGGWVTLPTSWVQPTAVFMENQRDVPFPVAVEGEEARVHLPPLNDGGLLRVARPLPPGGWQQVEVTAPREPTLAEILARHHRQAALQNRLVASFRGWQRLRVLVRIQELDRSFELELAGPVFFTPDPGRDWELREARLNGTVWAVEELPELPLIQAKSPPVPPLALELTPSYRYRLLGPDEFAGRSVFVLAYEGRNGEAHLWGEAFIDRQTFGLVALKAWQHNPNHEVRRSFTFTRNRLLELEGSPVWLPWRVDGDDVVTSFGGVAAVHRQLTLDHLEVNRPDVTELRTEAWKGVRPMLRESHGEVVFLEPDGSGGRRPVPSGRRRQSFLLGGGFWDPSVSFPIPLFGYQLLDFSWRGNQQLRLFLAGAVNDVAWSRLGAWEPRVGLFLQLAPFVESQWRREREFKGEEVYLWRQKARVGVRRQVGAFRLEADVGADFLHFSRTAHTDPGFRLPQTTVEPQAWVQGFWQRGGFQIGAQWEEGKRLSWGGWGFQSSAEPRFSRGGVFFRYERTPWPLVKFSLAGDFATCRRCDRFSQLSLGGFWGGSAFLGLPGGRVHADRLGVLKANVALPWWGRKRLELHANVGWIRSREQHQRATPVSGVGMTLSQRGPWGTLLQTTVGMPIVVGGPNQPVVQLVLLRPWR